MIKGVYQSGTQSKGITSRELDFGKAITLQ